MTASDATSCRTLLHDGQASVSCADTTSRGNTWQVTPLTVICLCICV